MLGNEDERTIDETFVLEKRSFPEQPYQWETPYCFPVADINQAPLTTLGPVIEKDPRFPEGVNVEFVETVSADELHFRVWERGSGITQACGTGACAAAVASVLNGVSERNRDITVHLAGAIL